ncbi:hypothetical protein PIB30_000328 [Stylosanthes scabra]|uniref:Uncharacterized protein n=1 Tax=Stylosanthes scabra TaxID=79078 RepID=A0ABU6T474_9FABA|nr:hypothetical protein [Stylosanthes scabra]
MTWSWTLDWRRALQDWELADLKSLIQTLSKVNMRKEDRDAWVWEFDKKGEYSVLTLLAKKLLHMERHSLDQFDRSSSLAANFATASTVQFPSLNVHVKPHKGNSTANLWIS